MKKIFIILFFSISSLSYAHKYYVSSSGNDTNNGLTMTTPWKTLTYAEAHAITPGDTIALKKGDTWLLDNVLDISHGGTSGSRIIWDGALWGSGANAKIQANSDGGAKPKYYCMVHIAGCDYLTMQNIIFDVNDKNRNGITIGGSNQVEGPTAQNSESYITIQDCSILDAGTGSYYCQGILVRTWNTNMSNITIQRNTVNGTGAQAICFYPGRTDSAAPAPYEISTSYVGYNTITNMGRSGSLGSGIFINNKVTGIIVEHNTVTIGTGEGFGIAVSSNEPTLGYFPTDVIIRYNDVRMSQACIYIEHGQAKSVDTYYNKLYSSGASSSGVIIITESASPAYTGASFNFYNNTIVTPGASMAGYRDETKITGICTFKNNIVINTAASGYDCVVLGVPGSTIHANNVYYRINAGHLLYVTSSNYNYGSTDLTWEPTAIIADPLLEDRDGFNWHLQAGSPAIGAGIHITTPTISTDYAGTALKNPPSIGAYESGSTASSPVVPVYQSSVVANATPSLLEMTYSTTLANMVPASSSFSVLVNSLARTVNSVVISGTKVQLTLSSALKFGDIVTVSYTKPATNLLQSTTGGVGTSISAQSVTNNLTNAIKDATSVTVTMTLSPNHVHKILNVLLAYSSTPTSAMSPEIIQITDLSGTLFMEKLLITGVTNIKMPLNLDSGIYTVVVLGNGLKLASQKMIAY